MMVESEFFTACNKLNETLIIKEPLANRNKGLDALRKDSLIYIAKGSTEEMFY